MGHREPAGQDVLWLARGKGSRDAGLGFRAELEV